MKPFFHKNALVTGREELSPGLFHFTLEAPEISAGASPGQFIHVEAPGRSLRRAFSISGTGDDTVSIIFKVVGTGTLGISAVKKGERLDILGPLGKGFPLPAPPGPVFAAGGLGAAPLAFLASRSEGGVFIYGAKKECEFIPERLLGTARHRLIKVCEEKTGKLVTDLLKNNLDGAGAVYSAGPCGMLKAAASVCSGRVKTYVSWEERMGCGTGLCQGCPVMTTSGIYKMTCSDGPVFDAEEIDWDAC